MPARLATIVVALLAGSGLACSSGDDGTETNSATATTPTTATTATTTTPAKPSPPRVISCRAAKGPRVIAAAFRLLPKGAPIRLRRPAKDINAKVALVAASARKEIGIKEKLRARNGTFVFIRYRVTNNGRERAFSPVPNQFVLKSGENVYGPPTKCPAAVKYAARTSMDDPSKQIGVGQTKTFVVAYVVPTRKSLQWLARGTGRGYALPALKVLG